MTSREVLPPLHISKRYLDYDEQGRAIPYSRPKLPTSPDSDLSSSFSGDSVDTCSVQGSTEDLAPAIPACRGGGVHQTVPRPRFQEHHWDIGKVIFCEHDGRMQQFKISQHAISGTGRNRRLDYHVVSVDYPHVYKVIEERKITML